MKKPILFTGVALSGPMEGKEVIGVLHTCIGNCSIESSHGVVKPVYVYQYWILQPKLPMYIGWGINDTFNAIEVDPKSVTQIETIEAKPEKKVNKVVSNSIDHIYEIAMSMADRCTDASKIEFRFNKLDEEIEELRKEFEELLRLIKYPEQFTSSENLDTIKERIKDESADVLFVLLHINHLLGNDLKSLLHAGPNKMFNRLLNPNYARTKKA